MKRKHISPRADPLRRSRTRSTMLTLAMTSLADSTFQLSSFEVLPLRPSFSDNLYGSTTSSSGLSLGSNSIFCYLGQVVAEKRALGQCMGNSASFPLAYFDVIGQAVTHERLGWNRNTLFLLLRKFLFILRQTSFLFSSFFYIFYLVYVTNSLYFLFRRVL